MLRLVARHVNVSLQPVSAWVHLVPIASSQYQLSCWFPYDKVDLWKVGDRKHDGGLLRPNQLFIVILYSGPNMCTSKHLRSPMDHPLMFRKRYV